MWNYTYLNSRERPFTSSRHSLHRATRQPALQSGQQQAIERQHAEHGHCQLDRVIHQRDLHPVRGHEGVAAGVEGDGEEQHAVHQIAEHARHRGRQPPMAATGQRGAQAREHQNVEHLPHGVGDEAAQGDAENEQVEPAQRRPPGKRAVVKQHRDGVGQYEGRQHHPAHHAPRRARPEQPGGEISRDVHQREAERRPGGVQAEQGDGQLHQIVAGDDDGDVQRGQSGHDGALASSAQVKREQHGRPFCLDGG